MPPLNTVAILSKSDYSGGGASRVACQLRELLSGHTAYQVDHWVGDAEPDRPLKSLRGGRIGNIGFRRSQRLSRRIGLPDFLTTEYVTHVLHRRLKYDLYHIHDISDAISPLSLSAISRRRPVIWTFHDCSPFTGGCIYPLDCRAYLRAGCTTCPQLGRWPLGTTIDHTRYMQRYKISLINKKISAVICPSKWIAKQAVLAGVSERLIDIIPNSVDTTVFTPRDMAATRHELGLPDDAPIVIVSAMDLANEFKGAVFAREALERVDHKLYILAVGQNSQSLSSSHEIIPIGYTSDRTTLAKYYSACDAVLFPSIEDNCPLALLEAMACGTPAVAFDTGGIAEIIEHNVDGWLAARGDAAGLAEGLKLLLTDVDRRRAWSDSARCSIVDRYSHQRFLDRHLVLYDRILSDS